jgi:hypothetical protein
MGSGWVSVGVWGVVVLVLPPQAASAVNNSNTSSADTTFLIRIKTSFKMQNGFWMLCGAD